MDRVRQISIIAHRGKTATVRSENTLEAFQKAIDLGIPQIDFDLRRSKDGCLISYHDRTIDNLKIGDLHYCEKKCMSGLSIKNGNCLH